MRRYQVTSASGTTEVMKSGGFSLRGNYMSRTVVTICTATLTFPNSSFCPHRVFMCSVILRTNSDYFPIQH